MPSVAPNYVSVSEVTSSSITVQWGAVDCTHYNADVMGYSVQYGVRGSGSTETMILSETEATISGLTSSTSYTIKVAALNSVGVGEYSSITAETDSKFTRKCHIKVHIHLGLYITKS